MYYNDHTGEFCDELDVWIGFGPNENMNAYKARSGVYLVQNLTIPMTIFHGETDLRVPVVHARSFVEKAKGAGKDDLVSFFELKGVGTRKHWGNATTVQMEDMAKICEENRSRNSTVLKIPEKGIMAGGGYLFTKRFSVVLDSLDKLAIVEYDIQKGYYRLLCDENCSYEVRIISNC